MKKHKYISDNFTIKGFQYPQPFYWPAYFWLWNDSMTVAVLLKQLQDMHGHKALSLCPLPEPKEFRYESMHTLMEPGYLTKEYFKLYQAVASKARQLNMDIWLYDEGGWPSGSACGRVTRSDPSLVSLILKCKNLSLKKGDSIQIPASSIISWVHCNRNRKFLMPKEIYIAEKEATRIDIFTVHRIGKCLPEDPSPFPHPDLLNPETTKRFIELTHNSYKQIVGRYFGTTINRTFTDESAVAYVIPEKQIPWTEDLPDEFRKSKGYDLLNILPALFSPPQKVKSTKDMQARIDFFDIWSKRFAQAYFGQIQSWCKRNNLLSGGHLGGEDDTLGGIKYGYGHILRVLRKLDIPGVDAIWRQIFPGKVNHPFPKYASTAAHQQGKPWAFTESFCVYGNGLTLEQMKWITDYQYVRGINLMVVGCYPLSTRNHLMAGERPHFGPVNPLWKYIENYHNYTARLSYLLSLGKPLIREAVYFPIRDLWAGGAGMEEVAEASDMLVRQLLENQSDFDFIDDDILESDSIKVVDGNFNVSGMKYNTIWISKSNWLSENTMRRLALFLSEGGCVNAIGMPRSGGPRGKTLRSFLKSSLKGKLNILSSYEDTIKYIRPLFKVTPKCSWLRVCARSLKSDDCLYFLTNEGKTDINVVVQFPQQQSSIQLDPETGRCWKPSDVSYSNGVCSISIHLPFAGSSTILFTDKKILLVETPARAHSTLFTLTDNWMARPIRSYKVGKYNFEVKDLKKKLMPVHLGDWSSYVKEDFSGDVEYVLRFRCSSDIVRQASLFDLGKICYTCQVVLNGKNLGKKSWHPFLFPIKGVIKNGTNELRIIVTNTLANQLTSLKTLTDWSKRGKKGWQLGPYQRMAVKFEQESRKSGLFGPVRILSRYAFPIQP